jgi:hypothetical protein
MLQSNIPPKLWALATRKCVAFFSCRFSPWWDRER